MAPALNHVKNLVTGPLPCKGLSISGTAQKLMPHYYEYCVCSPSLWEYAPGQPLPSTAKSRFLSEFPGDWLLHSVGKIVWKIDIASDSCINLGQNGNVSLNRQKLQIHHQQNIRGNLVAYMKNLLLLTKPT